MSGASKRWEPLPVRRPQEDLADLDEWIRAAKRRETRITVGEGIGLLLVFFLLFGLTLLGSYLTGTH